MLQKIRLACLFVLYLCTAGFFSTTSFAQSCVGQPLFPAGTYTINAASPTSGTNFVSFHDAVNAITCGVAGPVVFNVVPNSGTYNEQVIIPLIANTSATNTVTFNGSAGDTLAYYSSNDVERATLKLNGAKNIIINNLVIYANNPDTAFGVQLINNADSNKITNCTVISSTSSLTAAATAGILINGAANSSTGLAISLCDYNVISNNTVIGGYVGIGLVAKSSQSMIKGNQVINNTILDFGSYGVYANGNDSTLLSGNDISRPYRNNTAGSTYAINFTNQTNRTKISKNRIHDLYTNISSSSTFYGIFVSGSGTAVGNENEISNNLVYNIQKDLAIYGMSNLNSPNTRYYNNTIALDDTNAVNTTVGVRGFHYTSGTTGVVFKNNIISVGHSGTGPKYCISTTSTVTVSANNNVYYMHASAGSVIAVGYLSTSYVTLTDWRAATTQDANSVATDPMYINPAAANFTPNAPAVNNIGQFVGVTTDILGNPRSATTPDPGAYEFDVLMCVQPTNLQAINITATTATAHWNTAQNALNYEYIIDQVATAPTVSGTSTTDTFYNASSLIPGATYYLHVRTHCNGYTSWATAPFTMLCNAPAAVFTASGPLAICHGDSLSLNSHLATGLSYQWILNGTNIAGATDTSYVPTQSGSYKLIVATSAYCLDTSAAQIVTITTPPTAVIAAVGDTNICAGSSVEFHANTGTSLSYQWQRSGAILPNATNSIYNADVSGLYDVIVTINGCSDTSAATAVVVTPIPQAGITAGSTTICTGDSMILSTNVASNYTYQWQYNGINVTGANGNTFIADTAGTYSVTVTQNNCIGTDTIIINEFPVPVPTVTHLGLDLTTSNTFSTYQWYLNGQPISGATDYIYTPQANGTYYVTVSDNNGCKGTSANYPVSDVGINELNNAGKIAVYPNPTQNILAFKVKTPVNASLYNLEGKRLLQQENVQQINIGNLPDGNYMLRLTDANGQLLYSTNVIKTSK